MADMLTQHNIGAYGDLVRMSDHETTTAAGAGDASTFTGNTIDREGFGNSGPSLSALMGVIYEATLASGKTYSIGYGVQHSPDNSTWTDYQTATYVVVATGISGGGVAKGQFNVQVDLTNAKRYVRFMANADLNATGTDTSYYDVVGFFAGMDRLPAFQS